VTVATMTTSRRPCPSASPTMENAGIAGFETYANVPNTDQPTATDAGSPPSTPGK
jgi:hypothetical protein